MPTALHAVAAVLRHQSSADALDQVAPLISQFLGPPPNLSLSEACRFQSTALLDWIWETSTPSEASRGPDWTLGNFLRSDEFYHRWQFGQSVQVAVELDNLVILEWLFGHFKGAIVPLDVVIKAAEQDNMPVLRFMLENDSKGEDNTVQWGAGSVQQALRANQLAAAHWLYENTPQPDKSEEQHTWTIKTAMDAGDLAFCQSLVPEGGCVLDYSEFCNTPEMIAWKLACGYMKRDPELAVAAIRDLALENRLDEMKTIAELHIPPPEDMNWVSEWREAVEDACKAAKLPVVEWLMEHPTGRLVVADMARGSAISRLLHHPAEKGDIDMMQFLHGQGAGSRLGNALIKAVCHDQMEAVKWLLERFPQTEKIPDYCLMDEAARHGCVEMLQLFQSLGPSGAPGFFPVAAPAPQPDANRGVQEQIPTLQMEVEHAGPNRRLANVYRVRSAWAPTDPMDDAAANGELAAVQWLHLNRAEGCTTAAMDSAAANGHLDVVKWLHANRSEGCTEDAMDFAAAKGYLEIVQWLHANSSGECTTEAMDMAADGSHFATLKWLRANRGEGCTAMALECAMENGHLDVACWIRQHYPALVPTKVSAPSPLSAFNVLLFMHAHYPHLITDDLVQNAHELLSPRYKRPNDVHIVDWLKANYPLPDLPVCGTGLAAMVMNDFMVVVQHGEDDGEDEDESFLTHTGAEDVGPVASRSSWRGECYYPVQPAALAGALSDRIGALGVGFVAVAICGWEVIAESTSNTTFWRPMLLVLPQFMLLTVIAIQFSPVLKLRMRRLVRVISVVLVPLIFVAVIHSGFRMGIGLCCCSSAFCPITKTAGGAQDSGSCSLVLKNCYMAFIRKIAHVYGTTSLIPPTAAIIFEMASTQQSSGRQHCQGFLAKTRIQ